MRLILIRQINIILKSEIFLYIHVIIMLSPHKSIFQFLLCIGIILLIFLTMVIENHLMFSDDIEHTLETSTMKNDEA